MAKVLIIGAGGVGNVVAHKCAEVANTFSEIILASRTLSRCNEIKERIKNKYGVSITTDKVDAESKEELLSLLKKYKPDIVINVTLPYYDLNIMDACLKTGSSYLDTANYESKDVVEFNYKDQWAFHKNYEKEGLTAILGCGFDPGVSNAYCAYAQKHYFDKIDYIDILDCNAGNHGKVFATNFNLEINLREFMHNGKYWENGKWIETPPILNENCVHFTFDYPIVGKYESYLIFHEELESLVKNIKGLKRIRFWMTFSNSYLMHFRVLHNLGLTRIDEVEYKGIKIVPLQFLQHLLPDPRTLGKNYTGKTVIGCIIEGEKGGKRNRIYLYNVCDHAESYKETGGTAIHYTTGVPAMVGALMFAKGKWKKPGVYNVEQFDPDPFIKEIETYGLPTTIENPSSRYVP